MAGLACVARSGLQHGLSKYSEIVWVKGSVVRPYVSSLGDSLSYPVAGVWKPSETLLRLYQFVFFKHNAYWLSQRQSVSSSPPICLVFSTHLSGLLHTC